MVDLAKSLQGHEDRDDEVGISNPIDVHGGISRELQKETHSIDFPIESLSNENVLPPQLNNPTPDQTKSLISKNKKRLTIEIKEPDSLAIESSKKRKKSYSKEQRMELARQAISSGNIKHFSEINGVPYSTLNAWTKKFKTFHINGDGESHMLSNTISANQADDEDFYSSQQTNSSQIDLHPLTPPKEDWLHKVSSTPIKDIQLPPLKNTITTHTPMNVSIIKKPQHSSMSSPITNMGITSINLGNGINITYNNSHVSTELQQDPEIVMGEAMSAPSNSLIRAAESSTVLAPIDTAIEESKTVSLE